MLNWKNLGKPVAYFNRKWSFDRHERVTTPLAAEIVNVHGPDRVDLLVKLDSTRYSHKHPTERFSNVRLLREDEDVPGDEVHWCRLMSEMPKDGDWTYPKSVQRKPEPASK